MAFEESREKFMADIAAYTRDFIDAMGLTDVTLVGNDTGGGLCQLVIDAYPDRVLTTPISEASLFGVSAGMAGAR